MATKYQYQAKQTQDSWDANNWGPWTDLPEGHHFSFDLDYRFREAPFEPGWFLHKDGDTIMWMNSEKQLGALFANWTRITELPPTPGMPAENWDGETPF